MNNCLLGEPASSRIMAKASEDTGANVALRPLPGLMKLMTTPCGLACFNCIDIYVFTAAGNLPIGELVWDIWCFNSYESDSKGRRRRIDCLPRSVRSARPQSLISSGKIKLNTISVWGVYCDSPEWNLFLQPENQCLTLYIGGLSNSGNAFISNAYATLRLIFDSEGYF